MAKIPRVRERTATAAELEEETERCRRAREAHRPLAPAPIEGNLCACLVTFAKWRPCCVCGAVFVLYVNAQARTDGDVECSTCQGIREDLAKRLRYTKLSDRVRFHLRSLFAVANDNHEARA